MFKVILEMNRRYSSRKNLEGLVSHLGSHFGNINDKNCREVVHKSNKAAKCPGVALRPVAGCHRRFEFGDERENESNKLKGRTP